jgi:hypothetical protein
VLAALFASLFLGAVATLGDPWLEAVRDEARRRSLALLAGPTRIEAGRIEEDVVILGASVSETRAFALKALERRLKVIGLATAA